MSKMMIFDNEARQKLLNGIEKIAAAVRVTMGPKGRNVILEKAYGSPSIINDGVSIAKEIDLEDPYENLGAQLVKEVANKTNENAGDGTTTATVLISKIYKEGLKKIESNISPIAIKRGIDKAVKAMVEELVVMKKPIETNEEIQQVASISANNDDEIGSIISNAMAKVGKEGVVTIEESKTSETTVETTDGMQFDQGYVSPYLFTNPQNMEATYDDVKVLISEDKIDDVQALTDLMARIHNAQIPLLIIADDYSPEAISILVLNKIKIGFRVIAVKAPGFGDRRKDILDDLCALTGATKISNTMGKSLKDFDTTDLGKARKVITDKSETTIVDGGGDKEKLEERIQFLKNQKEDTASAYDKERIQERISKLSGGIAVLSVGANTQTVMTEKKLRVEDALNATRAAIAEGIVPGGGVALVRARKVIKKLKLEGEEQIGANIIYEAVSAPLWQIAENAGIDGNVAIHEVEKLHGNFGLNAATGEYVDLIAAGVIDPTKVTRSALENAADIAGSMLTTECAVVSKKEEKKEPRPEDF